MVAPNHSIQKRIHFRNILREARYGALAEDVGFLQMCFDGVPVTAGALRCK